MARMRGPDYGSMLRAIYEPRLQRQTAKENFKLKQDALNEQIRANKAKEQQAILDAEQRLAIAGDYDTRAAAVVAGREDVQAHEIDKWNRTEEHDLLTKEMDWSFRGNQGLLNRRSAKELAEMGITSREKISGEQIGASKAMQTERITSSEKIAENQLGLGYDRMAYDAMNTAARLKLEEDKMKYPYESVALSDFQQGLFKELGWKDSLLAGATAPRGAMGAITAGGFNMLGYDATMDRADKKAVTGIEASGAAPLLWENFKSEQATDPMFRDESAVHQSMKTFDDAISLPSPGGGATPWVKAKTSFDPKYGDGQFGDNIIVQYGEMLKETQKPCMQHENFLGMDVWSGEKSIKKSRNMIHTRLRTLLKEKYKFEKARGTMPAQYKTDDQYSTAYIKALYK